MTNIQNELLLALKNAIEGLETLKPIAGIYTAPCESAIEQGKKAISKAEDMQ